MRYSPIQKVVYRSYFWFIAFLIVVAYSILSTGYIIYLLRDLYHGAAHDLRLIDENLRTLSKNLSLCHDGKLKIPVMCQSGWKYLKKTNSCYRAFDVELSFTDARAICKESTNDRSQVDLVSIQSLEENQFVYDLFPEAKGAAWIGLEKFAKIPDFDGWTNGKVLNYRLWGNGEPGKDDGHLGAVIQLGYGDLDWQHWKTVDIMKKHQFVCQQRLEKETRDYLAKQKREKAMSKCMDCMCAQENCQNDIGCVEVWGRTACGNYQITFDYYIDCGMPKWMGMIETQEEAWKRCSQDISCSRECIANYYNRWETNCPNKTMTICERMIRLHKGGPNGCNQNMTLPFWNAARDKCS
ncbi:unnamed protein product, partial [Mesorhabditis belari]|uniref:lysozyme n=1 Tax=Mesorhabditis belari TaxID=2138241 RepID=A0AAF3EE54_9BILA